MLQLQPGRFLWHPNELPRDEIAIAYDPPLMRALPSLLVQIPVPAPVDPDQGIPPWDYDPFPGADNPAHGPRGRSTRFSRPR